MKRWLSVVAVLAGLCVTGGTAQASWGELCYSGYQPWWNIFAQRYKCLTPEEARLQKFWHDYYDALQHYYSALDHIDWVAYYKNHGYQINAGCGPAGCGGCGRINYAPVFVNPQLSWAVPHQSLQGPIANCGFAVPPSEGYAGGGMIPPGYAGGQMPPQGYVGGPMPAQGPGGQMQLPPQMMQPPPGMAAQGPRPY